mmetsp:Transcript_2743/g.5915  ORF Transcript_2743/g.5915 Transcript_2743/m.5915 type:complete len:121 (-) Transcript_2743:101-463(-)
MSFGLKTLQVQTLLREVGVIMLNKNITKKTNMDMAMKGKIRSIPNRKSIWTVMMVNMLRTIKTTDQIGDRIEQNRQSWNKNFLQIYVSVKSARKNLDKIIESNTFSAPQKYYALPRAERH